MIDNENINESVKLFNETLYSVSSVSKVVRPQWERMLKEKDSKSLWRGINWNGEFRESDSNDRPPEVAFHTHMERLLNTNSDPRAPIDVSEQVSIPALEEPYSFNELNHVMKKQIKPNKGCGPDGVSPGTSKLLPNTWVWFLLSSLNIIFLSGSYPITWGFSKLVMLYKKGYPLNCGNYRGISVMNCLAKCYDYLLNNRLIAWYQGIMVSGTGRCSSRSRLYRAHRYIALSYKSMYKKKVAIIHSIHRLLDGIRPCAR